MQYCIYIKAFTGFLESIYIILAFFSWKNWSSKKIIQCIWYFIEELNISKAAWKREKKKDEEDEKLVDKYNLPR
jgi:hypothetical protein